jgi:hypothetical protein
MVVAGLKLSGGGLLDRECALDRFYVRGVKFCEVYWCWRGCGDEDVGSSRRGTLEFERVLRSARLDNFDSMLRVCRG